MLFVFGKEPRGFPSILAVKPIQIVEGAGVYPLQLLIPVIGLLLATALHLFTRRTRHGVAMLAVVQNPGAARLMGIDVGRAIAASYAASAVLAGIAALLIAPLFNVSSEMGTLFGIKACRRDHRRPRQRMGRVLAGLCPRSHRGVRHQLSRLGLHTDHHIRFRHRDSRRSASRLLGRAGVKKV